MTYLDVSNPTSNERVILFTCVFGPIVRFIFKMLLNSIYSDMSLLRPFSISLALRIYSTIYTAISHLNIPFSNFASFVSVSSRIWYSLSPPIKSLFMPFQFFLYSFHFMKLNLSLIKTIEIACQIMKNWKFIPNNDTTVFIHDPNISDRITRAPLWCYR